MISTFYLKVKVTEILKYISTLFWGETWSWVRDKLPSFRKMLVLKIVLPYAIEK